jgi:hypothetical protein
MARPIVINWPVTSNTVVSSLQTLGAAGNLVINNGPNGFFDFVKVTRSITLTSTNNLSGVNFTITGTLNGATISEVLAGPNNNTVTSVNIYDTITSIASNAAAAAVSAGSGQTGRTRWINFDYDQLIMNYSVQVVVGAATINYTFNTTLDDVNVVATPTLTAPVGAMTAATTTQFATLTTPINYANVTINSSNSTGTLTLTLLIQGIGRT